MVISLHISIATITKKAQMEAKFIMTTVLSAADFPGISNSRMDWIAKTSPFESLGAGVGKGVRVGLVSRGADGVGIVSSSSTISVSPISVPSGGVAVGAGAMVTKFTSPSVRA